MFANLHCVFSDDRRVVLLGQYLFHSRIHNIPVVITWDDEQCCYYVQRPIKKGIFRDLKIDSHRCPSTCISGRESVFRSSPPLLQNGSKRTSCRESCCSLIGGTQ